MLQRVTSKLKFPFLDLRAQYATIRPQVAEAVQRVLETQQFIFGAEVEAFEREVAQVVGAKFARGCASGSDALLLALMALEVGADDEVITTPFTFVATAGSIARLGARPVFVDVEPDTFNIDAKQNVMLSRKTSTWPVRQDRAARTRHPHRNSWPNVGILNSST